MFVNVKRHGRLVACQNRKKVQKPTILNLLTNEITHLFRSHILLTFHASCNFLRRGIIGLYLNARDNYFSQNIALHLHLHDIG